MLGFLPCAGQLAEVPADFRNRVTGSYAAHLSVNRPLLGDDDWLAFEKKVLVSSCLKFLSVWIIQLTVDEHVEKLLEGGVFVTG